MAATEKNRNPSLEGALALLSCFVDLWLHSIVHTHVPTFVTHGHQLDIGGMFLCLFGAWLLESRIFIQRWGVLTKYHLTAHVIKICRIVSMMIGFMRSTSHS